MFMRNISSKILMVLALVSWVCATNAQVDQFGRSLMKTNGYLCEPKNPGGEETRLYFRQQDGVAINLSSTATFPVVCPVLTTVIPNDLRPFNGIGVRFGNGRNVTQKFQCALEEYDIGFNLVRSTGKAITLAPFTTNTLQYFDIKLQKLDNYFSLRCIIPPRGQVGHVISY